MKNEISKCKACGKVINDFNEEIFCDNCYTPLCENCCEKTIESYFCEICFNDEEVL